ncbi:MAG TPA: HAMP domain-containing protein [Actinocrinis sp.]|nr:HAMP domain-containing protein [Actinocrinis sp.]
MHSSKAADEAAAQVTPPPRPAADAAQAAPVRPTAPVPARRSRPAPHLAFQAPSQNQAEVQARAAERAAATAAVLQGTSAMPVASDASAAQPEARREVRPESGSGRKARADLPPQAAPPSEPPAASRTAAALPAEPAPVKAPAAKRPGRAATSAKTPAKPPAKPLAPPATPTPPTPEPSDDLSLGLAALRAARDGDLRARWHVAPGSELAEAAEIFNELISRQQHLGAELSRVAGAAGRGGRLTERMAPGPGSGAWESVPAEVNEMLDLLAEPLAEADRVLGFLAAGELGRANANPVALTAQGRALRGDVLTLATTVNRLAEQMTVLYGAVQWVAVEVGGSGRTPEHRQVPWRTVPLPGQWAQLLNTIDLSWIQLGGQVQEILRVITAVADGDLSRKVEGAAYGTMAELKQTINSMVDQLSEFSSEVIRVARELGTDGRLGGQANVPVAAGIWRDLTDSVNSATRNLTAQVRDIAGVTTAVARGDLTQKITVEVAGEMSDLKETINAMVDQLSGFADEVTRVALEVGTEGQLGGQAQVPGVAGTWKDLTDSVNLMASNLTNQVRNIAQVTTAVARGDLSEKIQVDARGEVLELKETINAMVDQLSGFADEVTRVAREVGTEGQLGGQAQVLGVAGTWKDLTDSVNLMASNLTNQVRNIAQVTTAVARGDLSQKIQVDARGEILQLKETINTMVDQLSAFADEVTRVAREVGTEGQLGGQAHVRGVDGTWKDLTDNVNVMANNLTSQVREIAQVATAVARGDLGEKIQVDARGEVLELKSTINAMVDQLSAFAGEVTRVAREVGTEGQLGGQAQVPGVAGTWKDLTDNVNVMANNLTSQVRNIAQVTTAVARGDLSKRIDVEARGEILELKTTINTMVAQLSAFAAEVTRVAREVGTEGKLGGQATVEGVSGTWQRLTESVNQLAGNLTTQVRAIAEVATAVTSGDLTQQIDVDASGEVAELKDNINRMITNLRETIRLNQEQDWLKGNLARISALMQGKRDLAAVAELIMAELTPVVAAQNGAFYLRDGEILRMIAGYGVLTAREGRAVEFRLREGLVGQVAEQRTPILIDRVPAGYLPVATGLGSAPPAALIVLPVLFEDRLLAVIELASFERFTEIQRAFLDQIVEAIGVTVNTIMANSVTEDLLTKSRQLTTQLEERSEELQKQQEELRHSNNELEDKAALLARQNKDIEVKNFEIEQARQALEERADQLALASKYKSEFLANMSHELRTPLNSLLILARLLADNSDQNLSPKQIQFAENIHSAGSDLLELISDILDLSKIEAGRMDVQLAPIALSTLVEYVEATFRPMAVEQSLDFTVTLDKKLPTDLRTDEQRLQQVLRNLLSNAVKFTESGSVELRVALEEGVRLGGPVGHDRPVLRRAVSFAVADTGIGIAEDKLRIIFEAFQQADGTISRRHGGTGLGLSISREIAQLLGGGITVSSTLGRGSVFTLYLPLDVSDVEFGPDPADGGPLALAAGPAALTTGPNGVAVLAANGADPAVRELSGVNGSAGAGLPGGSGGLGGPAGYGAPGGPDQGPGPENRRGRSADGHDPSPALLDPRQPDLPPQARFEGGFSGETVLIVDDDVRNVFALTSVLEQHGLTVRYAENGRVAIEQLETADRIDLVLMDIMMPEMDGYATTRAIRETERFTRLPIIALTAKAMVGDREKALAAGASAYVTKPVDTDRLLTLIHSWCAAR